MLIEILLINKFLYPKGGDAVVALGTGELLRAHGRDSGIGAGWGGGPDL